MRSKLHWIALFALLASIFVNAMVFGALVQTPVVGQGVRIAAHFASPLAFLYVNLGKFVTMIPGVLEAGSALVATAWAPLFERISQTPQIALDILLEPGGNSTQAVLRANYWATPVLACAWAICWYLRPKTVHLVRTRGR